MEEVRDMSSFGDDLETLEEMAATIAHEIKNPLALALANLDLIKVNDIDAKYSKYCAVIEQELYTINSLVLDLIHITLSDEPEELFDLTALLDELTLEYRRRYENITFTRKPGLSPAYIRGLVKNIRMVFTNILNNAIEAISQKGVVQLEQETVQDTIHIVIRDNGIGLAEDDDLLLRSGGLYTTKENGTGVGLRFCRSTVSRHGGRFKIENRPEGGCEVTVTLPIKHI